ncbi:probable DNA mismatch repair protein Msh6 [Scaptodrosophila lebanonensis]|uniref:DNA mismatch repair protein n=1 Tax=Drosophila lebanonensis TaxID=7225 RepID=A0A6J2TK11_DROLE|nr:probable DNA mismatch repair protein Msh6 [Scaptodrosophila lebanonensis]
MSRKLGSNVGGTPTNTLFKYFSKSPAVEKRILERDPKTNYSTEATETTIESGKENFKRNSSAELTAEFPIKKERKLISSLSPDKMDDVDDELVCKRKRKRIIMQESSEDEHQPDFSDDESEYEPNDDTQCSERSETDAEMDIESSDCETRDLTLKKTRNKLFKNRYESDKKKLKLETSQSTVTFIEKLMHLQSNVKTEVQYDEIPIMTNNPTLDEPAVWPHQKLEFLLPDHIKDKAGRRPDHPHYDKSTLHVPEKFLNTLSPGVRQWWVLKSENYDCVLFFKVGKFYELYHMDADIGVKELGFTYMRGEFAHSGFPEISFDKMSTILVDKGYKVARVEQTETPEMMTERCKRIKPTKYDKVVMREICQITDRGTQVFGLQCSIGPNHQPNYMLALVENDEGVGSKFGICFVDTSIGDFNVGEFSDDKSCSRLLTLLSHHKPVLFLSEKGSLSERTRKILRTVLASILKEQLPCSGAQVCSAERTLKILAERFYPQSASENDWPPVLRTMKSDTDHLGITPAADYKLALKALGQCIHYLNKCKLELKVLPMARYQMYVPPDVQPVGITPILRRSQMVLDATTLANLRIIGEEHSLEATLDHCCTKFGKRLLRQWLCAPSCDLVLIRERQAAIGELLQLDDELQKLRALIATLPDLERYLAQIHLFGNKRIAQDDHPDSRAILFEQHLYNKQRLSNFIAILKGFETLGKLPILFRHCKSDLLRRLTQQSAAGGIFPDLSSQLNYFAQAFDHTSAAKTGTIAPQPGADSDYDSVQTRIADIDMQLKTYLVDQERYFGCRLTYFGSDKKRYQLDVPETHAHKANHEYALEGQVKGKKPARRYSTAQTKAFLKEMQKAEEARTAVLNDLARRIFEKFSNHYEKWKQCIDCVSNLDVLGALAVYARQQHVVCVPEIIASDVQHFIEIEDGYHPCVNTDTYIPNGLKLGSGAQAPLSILTGPNMGGKSTLMRQLGLLVVMAQVGAHIPAISCRLSLVDRIFTRLGAQDDILAGHSTFLVELSEASLILKHATSHSLVLVDELGRGTATYDGTAIAASVVNFLADLKCRTLFSTHYHNLIDFFHNDVRISLGHMACMVENEDMEDPTQETVTFLYKYTAGSCPKSYGFNAAKLAGMPQKLIKRAYGLSKRVETIALKRKIAAKLVLASSGCEKSRNELPNMLQQLKTCRI